MTGLGRFVVAQLKLEDAEQRRDAPRLFKLDDLLKGIQARAPIETPAFSDATPLERLEQFDAELAALLVTAAPVTWRRYRRAWRELVQSARRELATNGAVPEQLHSRRPAAPPAARRSRSERSRDPP